MFRCETCGNSYDKSFTVHIAHEEHAFDCFECAIAALAPRCFRCKTPIIGHGVEINEQVFCSAHCAKVEGLKGVCDRFDRIAI
jgi:hypothetical protein